MTRPDSNHTFVHHVAFWIIVGFFWMVRQVSFFNKLSESFINTLLDSWNMSLTRFMWTRFLQHFELLRISKTYTYWTCLLEVLLECFFHTVVANVSWTRLSNICLKDFLQHSSARLLNWYELVISWTFSILFWCFLTRFKQASSETRSNLRAFRAKHSSKFSHKSNSYTAFENGMENCHFTQRCSCHDFRRSHHQAFTVRMLHQQQKNPRAMYVSPKTKSESR